MKSTLTHLAHSLSKLQPTITKRAPAVASTPLRSLRTSTALHQYGDYSSSNTQHNDSPSSSSSASEEKRIFTSYVVHKGKGAVDINVIRPQLQPSRNNQYYTVKRLGGFALQFAVAKGERQYDWQNKEVIMLNVTEIGDFIHYYQHTSMLQGTSINITHDPMLGSQQQGGIVKRLYVQRMNNQQPAGGQQPSRYAKSGSSGYYFNLTVDRSGDAGAGNQRQPPTSSPSTQQRPQQIKISVPVTDGEMATIVTLMQQCLPSLLAFQTQLIPEVVSGDSTPSNANDTTMRYQ